MFNWHKGFFILPQWKKGKKTVDSESEVVLTHIKKLTNEYKNVVVDPHCCVDGSVLLHTDTSSDYQEAVSIKENESKLIYENNICEMGVSDSLNQLKSLFKFESEDSGVEMPSGANSPSTPKGSEKSFVMHSRDSSCDSGVLSASSSPTVGHVEMKAGPVEDMKHAFVSDIKKITNQDYTENVKESSPQSETTMEDFIECQEEELECGNENKVSTVNFFNNGLSSTMAEECKSMDDFYKDNFEDIQDLHEHNHLKRYPTSDSLDEYMDECCRLSEVNQGASKALGSGLGYLEHICQLIEKIGQLQEHNLKLQKQVFSLQKEDRMKQMREEYFGQHCSCGAASVLLTSYQESKMHFPVRRNRPHSMFVQSGNQSDLSMIPEIGVSYEKFGYKGANAQTDGRSSPSVLGLRKPLNKLKYEERNPQMWERNYNDGFSQPDQEMKKLEIHPWGRVRDLLKKTKTKNQNKLGLSSASLKRSCPQLYRPDLFTNELKRKDRNSMIVLSQNVSRENAWSSLYVLNRKEDDM
ncbi:Hypothetical predicted protein [Pelobates cultripes]|uniref:DUF4657 domain-containing protein n=1 Tax=Pelobates cultripes TaxID=61616 RepID=A0AAD1TFA3_PELCU|nr:Hypothetical predicted protein [Pelobates cultripes]